MADDRNTVVPAEPVGARPFERVAMTADGGYRRPHWMLALIAREGLLPIEWGLSALMLQFPPNVARDIWGMTHPDADLARNLALEYALGLASRPQAVCLVEAPHLVPWDAWVRYAQTATGAVADPTYRAAIVPLDVIAPLPPPWWEAGRPRGWEAEPVTWLTYDDDAGEQPSLVRPPEAIGLPEITTVLAIPTLGYVSLPWVLNFFQMAFPVASIRELFIVKGYEVAEARELAAEHVLALTPRPKFFAFYGDDMLMPTYGWPRLFDTMVRHRAPAVAALYRMKTPYEQPLIWMHGRPGLLMPGVDYQLGDVIEADGTGLDAVVMHTDALAMVKPPRFRTGMEVIGRALKYHTEDAWFWRQFYEATGRRPLVDTSVQVGHYDVYSWGVY